VTNPDGGKTTVAYSDAGPNPNTITSVAMSSSATKTSESIFDAYGHVLHVKLTSDPEGTDTVDTTYDGLGLPYTVSNPYRSTSDSTYGLTTYTYDALGRTLNQLRPDSSSLKWSYSSNVTTFTDEALHSWARTSDAFGRLTNVTEPNGAATGYSYNALNNLLTVTQNGLFGETPRLPRSFVYDSLSRLTSASNPETGIIGYVYDANSNVTKKTDARSIAMNYSYDVLNRLIGKVASDGSINYSYAYDGAGQGASVGRLTHSSNDVNAAHFLIYDVMGRVNQETYCIPSDCSYATSFHATYDLAGNVTSLTYPDGRVVNQTWDGGGHLTQVSDSSNGNIYLKSSSTYWPTGAPSAIFYGNGVGNGYDENNRLQINEIGLVRVGSSAPGNYTGNNNLSVKEYCYGPATSALSSSIPGCPSLAVANNGNIGQITDILNSADTQNFTHDSLNRISTFKIAGATNQTFQIDSFGNMTQSGTLNSGLTFQTNNNRTNTPGYVYDAAGSMTVGPPASVKTRV
jgi:YD repeat-containing protein